MWYYNSNIIDNINQFPEGAFGYIYLIKNIDDGTYYIGKKNLYSERNIKLGKKELLEQEELKKPGRKKLKKKVIKESDWLNYWSSNKNLKDAVKELGESAFKREILKICFSKKQLTWYELEYQVKNNVLMDEKSLNDNILGSFYRKDLIFIK